MLCSGYINHEHHRITTSNNQIKKYRYWTNLSGLVRWIGREADRTSIKPATADINVFILLIWYIFLIIHTHIQPNHYYNHYYYHYSRSLYVLLLCHKIQNGSAIPDSFDFPVNITFFHHCLFSVIRCLFWGSLGQSNMTNGKTQPPSQPPAIRTPYIDAGVPILAIYCRETRTWRSLTAEPRSTNDPKENRKERSEGIGESGMGILCGVEGA